MTVRLNYRDLENHAGVNVVAVTTEQTFDQEGEVQSDVRTDGENVEFLVSELSEDMQQRLKAYGLKQILADRVSSTKDPIGKLEGMEKVYSMLKEDRWTEARKSSGIKKPKLKRVDPYLAQAIAAIKGVDVLAITAKLGTMSVADTKTLASNEKVAAKIEEIKAEAVQAANDLDLDLG